MATNTLNGYNIEFAIKNADGTAFHDLVLHKSTVESVVMSLGDKITGDVYYKDNTLAVTMQEYVEYNGVHYVLVSPPTIVREGMASDNSELKGMTKYSFVFYHPMYMLGNFPFTDVAVTQSEAKYLSQNKTFSWIGTLFDLRDKLNANLASTEWYVEINIPQYEQDGTTETQQWQKANELSEVLSFDKQFISDVLKTGYDQWEIPFVIVSKTQTINGVTKNFAIQFGLPSQEIYDADGVTPFVFKFGQGVGLKNNSRTPKNNKIITRLAGYGAERNIPYGYPQIVWYGDQSWEYTINNDSSAANSYPIYDGIVGGKRVRLIKHPFTRKTLMPTVYTETVFNKVSPYAVRQLPSGAITANSNYDPNTVIIDYHDAPVSYPNPINVNAPLFETHQFEEVYPRLGDAQIAGVSAYDDTEYISISDYQAIVNGLLATDINDWEKFYLNESIRLIWTYTQDIEMESMGGSTTEKLTLVYHSYNNGTSDKWFEVSMVSPSLNFKYNVYYASSSPETYVQWDDSMDDDGNYKQSYFQLTLPQLNFDIYACASITEEMKINMRSGACIGCTFTVQVDWDDYKKNFYQADGTFDPVIHTTEGDGHVRDGQKYPDSSQGQITVIVQKDNETFGTLMPNIYQKPSVGDLFVILGISLPTSYITAAQTELDGDIDEYILENNVHYYDYPLKFDEYFFAQHPNILSQVKNNSILLFEYAGVQNALYIKQIVIKYGDNVLPQYDITLTDDVEIVLNQIGQVTDDVSRIRVQLNELQKYYGEDLANQLAEKLSKVVDDVCQGRITFQQGLNALGAIIMQDDIRSSNFTSGLYSGSGWRIDELGNAEFESVRVRSFLEIVQLVINRMQAQEGDTLFTDNDQIDKVEEKTYNGTTYYKLSLKEKWDGYVTPQQVDNILKGVMNTLAAQQGNVSDVTASQSVETDGDNKFYTSWMKVINPSSVNDTVETNQICVIIYGDASVPAGKNFKPCELMTIARWGCDADPEASGLTPAQKADIERRQRIFSISTSDGRIAKLRGIRRPILDATNYGTTLGIVPDFINQWSIASRLIEGRDYLYAQGIIVGDFIKVDALGNPQTNYVDCGNWQDNTAYLHEAYNSTTLQWETNDVWHNGSYWRCKVSQPYQGTYYEPTEANSLYWEKLLDSGDDGKTITEKLTMQTLNIPCDASGNSKASGNKDCYVTMYVDGTAVQTSSMTLTVISKPSGITVQTHDDVSQISKNRLYIIYSANVARSNLEGNILFSISDGTNTTYSSIAVVCANDGQQGKTGRFFYYGKEFNTSRTDTFSATDTEAPFFYYNSNYWLYKGENFSNKTITQIQTAYGVPASGNSNWEIMVSDFKYLITEAIFGSYAHFGSAIISGDWLLSQHGTVNGVASTNYTAFDPTHPNDNTGTNFIPNFCVDLLTGTSYQNKVEVRGNIHANKIYTRLERLNLNELYDSSIHGVDWDDIDWENITSRYKDGVLPSVLVLMSGNVSAGQNRPVPFILPNASDWSNFMFDLYVQKTYKYTSGSTTYFSDEIKVYANGGSQTAFTDLLNGGDGYYIYESYSIPTSNGNTMNAHNKDKNTFVAGWKPCWHVKLLSDGSQWVVVEQEDSDIFTV